LDMHLMWTYQKAAEMEEQMGMPVYAKMYRDRATQLKKTIQKKYWVAERNLFADTKEKKTFSQPANTFAVLSGMVTGTELKSLSKKLETDTSLVKCTIYFRYYMHQAMVKGGLGDHYLSWLDVWRDNIKTGLTTWAEISDLKHVRSDCHAWGASPNIEFFRTVLGIDSEAPGFKKIKIEPHLGDIKNISGEMPHPDGVVAVNYSNDVGKWNISINIPSKTTGVFVWKGKRYLLKGGSNSFSL
jgi:alpha-L-rhamnosidase